MGKIRSFKDYHPILLEVYLLGLSPILIFKMPTTFQRGSNHIENCEIPIILVETSIHSLELDIGISPYELAILLYNFPAQFPAHILYMKIFFPKFYPVKSLGICPGIRTMPKYMRHTIKNMMRQVITKFQIQPVVNYFYHIGVYISPKKIWLARRAPPKKIPKIKIIIIAGKISSDFFIEPPLGKHRVIVCTGGRQRERGRVDRSTATSIGFAPRSLLLQNPRRISIGDQDYPYVKWVCILGLINALVYGNHCVGVASVQV